MNVRHEKEKILDQWDQFIERRGLPYYRNDHQLMMRQILQRYPVQKLVDVSDRDLLETINLGSNAGNNRLHRSFRFFLSHFDVFLETLGIQR